jgi:D-alanine-D-alanine ligase
LQQTAEILDVEGYCRIDAFVRIYENAKIETIIIEINSLPGMTPATCIFHQAAINNLKPLDFINSILEYGKQRATEMTVG